MFGNTFGQEYEINQGVSQGNAIHVFIFAIYLANLVKPNNQQSKLIIYADDVILLFDPNTHSVIEFRAFERQIQAIKHHLEQIHLKLSVEKSKIVLFTKHNIPLNLRHNRLTDIEISDQVKYLGICYHCKLNWNTHIFDLITKAEKKI